jgi:hypothetical protein
MCIWGPPDATNWSHTRKHLKNHVIFKCICSRNHSSDHPLMKKFEISMKRQFKIYIHLHNSAQNIGNNGVTVMIMRMHVSCAATYITSHWQSTNTQMHTGGCTQADAPQINTHTQTNVSRLQTASGARSENPRNFFLKKNYFFCSFLCNHVLMTYHTLSHHRTVRFPTPLYFLKGLCICKRFTEPNLEKHSKVRI